MDEAVKNLVRNRAQNTCEFCRLHQVHQPAFRFHIEHIRPKKHGGTIVPLFNPRTDSWSDHFLFQDVLLIGKSPVGRATIAVLAMNHNKRLQLRRIVGADKFE